MRRLLIAGGVAAALFAGATGLASADQDNGADAALCPVVGQGVPFAGEIPGGYTFLPNGGENGAGQHANANGLNKNGGPGLLESGEPSAPGTEGFTPIWNFDAE
jgi:hypothetical protein